MKPQTNSGKGVGSSLRETAGAVQSVCTESHGKFDIAAVPCWRQRAVERSPKRLAWAGSLSAGVGTLQLVVYIVSSNSGLNAQ